MSYFTGTAAHSTTGVKTVSVGFQPVGMRITVGQKVGTAQGFAHKSVGIADGTNQFYDAFFEDTTGGKTVSGSTKLVSHWERVTGTITEILTVTFDSFTATEVKYNVTLANVNYNLLIEAWS